MSSALTSTQAATFLYREALLLDQRDWDSWLDLYLPDAVFWMPAWRDEATPTADPDTEVSMIYYRGRKNLEDRVWRVRSGLSVASGPLLRVSHSLTNVLVENMAEGEASTTASFIVSTYDVRSDRTHAFFGRYEHHLIRSDDIWRIARKKILLLNDVIPTVLDFYSI